MPTVLSKSDKSRIKENVEEFASLGGEKGIGSYLFKEQLADGDIELRFFPTSEGGSVEEIHIEVVVNESADWYDETLGEYSADNIRNGNEYYNALGSELSGVLNECLNVDRVDFVKEEGKRAFTADVPV